MPIRLAYTSVGGAFGPAWLAQDLGLFAQEGLAVEMSLIGATEAAQALVAGDVQLIVAGANVAIEPVLAGPTLCCSGAACPRSSRRR